METLRALVRYFAHARALALWSLLLLALLLPFFFVPVNWMSVAASKMLIVAILAPVSFVACILAAFHLGELRFPRSALLASAGLLCLGYGVSAIASGSLWLSYAGYGATDTVAAIVLWSALFFSASCVLSAQSNVLTAIRLFGAGCAVAILAQSLHVALPSFTFGALAGLAANAVGSWQDFAILLGLCAFLSVSLLSARVFEGHWRYVFGTVATAAAAFLLIVNVYEVWMGIALLCFFQVAYLWRHVPPQGDLARDVAFKQILGWTIAGIAALGLFWGGGAIQSRLPSTLQIVPASVRPSWQGTLAVGKQVFSQPGTAFFGTGPGTFSQQWGLYKPLEVNQTQFWNADFYFGVGYIPTSFVTMGALGMIGWGAVLIALLISMRRLFTASIYEGASRMRAALLGSAAYLTVLHLLYTPGPALSALAFLFFGFLATDELHARSVRDLALPLAWRDWKSALYSCLAVAAALAVTFTGIHMSRAVLSESFVNNAIREVGATGSLAEASRSISTAIRIDPSNDRAHRAAVELGILQLAQIAASGDESDAVRQRLQTMLTETIQHGLTAISIEDRNYQNWLSLAYLYKELAGAGVAGAAESAQAAYEHALRDSPRNPLPRLGLAQFYIQAGDDAAAKEQLAGALELKPDLAVAHYLLSQIAAREDDLASALESAVAAAQYAPEDPLGWYNAGTILYAQGNYPDAITAFGRAVAIQNDYANALFLLGLSHYRVGAAQEALAALEAVAALNPGEANVTRIIDDIRAGRDPFAPEPHE